MIIEYLDEYIILNIFNYLSNIDIIHMYQIFNWNNCKIFTPKLFFKIVTCELNLNVELLSCFDCYVINDIFSSYKCLIGHGSLINDKNIVGHTGYIDCVTIEKMSGNINIGLDSYLRPYCSISGYFSENKKYCFTIFQRYTNDKKCWQLGTCYSSYLIFSGSLGSAYNNDIRESIKSMIEGRSYSVNNALVNDVSENNVGYNHPVFIHDL